MNKYICLLMIYSENLKAQEKKNSAENTYTFIYLYSFYMIDQITEFIDCQCADNGK